MKKDRRRPASHLRKGGNNECGRDECKENGDPEVFSRDVE